MIHLGTDDDDEVDDEEEFEGEDDVDPEFGFSVRLGNGVVAQPLASQLTSPFCGAFPQHATDVDRWW